ncbi:MAG: sel1 repeat family protein, partial [Kiritimatiellae bacterium]|nr:sel1 repeat family protein [Kiritimatiellia bacterium]
MAWFGFGRKKKSAAGEEHVQSDVISVPIRELHSRSDLSQLADESALLPDGMPYIGEPSLKPLDVATSITDESSTMNNSEDSPSPVPVSEKKIDTASRSTSEVSGHSLEKSNSENLGQYYTDGESKESFSIEENWYAVKGSDESIDYYQKGLLIDEPEQARKLFLKAAEKGNRKAQEKLAEMLFSGVGGPVDYSEAVTWFLASGPEDGEPEYQLAQCYEKLGNSEAAFEWYEMAAIHEVPSAKQDFLKIKANTGDVESQYLLGMELFSDLANPENRKEALVCLETASNSGHLGAQERLVAIYLEGEESLQDISRAMYWHKRIGLHDPEREFLFAEHYREAERIEDAICWYEKADVGGHAEAWRKCLQMKAETGDVHFQHDLALAYISGERIEKNIKKATEWLEKAATKGQREAQYELGKLLLSAETDDSNQQDGVAWLELAAEAGLEEAARVLFENYLDGDLIAEDPVLAARWFDQLGDDDGAIAFALGEAFLRQENQEDAIRWFKKAEEYGHPNATLQCLLIKAQSGTAYSQYSLAVAYASGDGVEQDHSKAVEWYRKAAVQGHAGAQNNLGFCYSRGAGVAKDPVEEVKWYRRAAEQADSTAESNLGLCYRYGTGVEKNLEEAARWFQKAVAQGNETAKKHLEEVKGELVNQSKAERKKLGIFPGIFFEEGSLIAEWLESLEEVGPGLGWTMVAATGSGPLQVEMMDNLLRDNDIDPAYCGDDGAS